jgi:hypothetical protein
MPCWQSCFQSALLPSAKSGPANLTSSTASAISIRTAIMWLAPPRPHAKRIRHTCVHEGVAVRLAGSSVRACHHGINFALLDEVKESFTGKLLFDGRCLTGLISGTCAGNQSAKSHSNSEGFHWLPPFLGRETILIAGDDPPPFRAGNHS